MYYGNANPKMALGVQGLTTTSTTQKMPCGTRVDLGDGRSFVYGSAAAAGALAPGLLAQSPAPIAAHKECAFVSVAADIVGKNTKLTVTLGAAALTVNQYADGYAVITKGTGLGQIFKIRSHAANAGSLACTFQLYDEVLTTCATSDSKVTLIAHPYSNMIIMPTTLTGTVTGIPLVNVAASYYGWLQVRGIAAVLNDASTVVIGATVMNSHNTAGTIEVTDLNSVDGGGQKPVIGVVSAVQESAEYSLIDLKL